MDNPALKLLPRACGAPSQGRFSEQAGTSAEAAGGEITAGGPSRCTRTFSPSPESSTISSRLADASVSAESRFRAQLPVIETVIAQVCRRHHLASTEAEEFGSEVMLHLIERDYEVLRRFQGRSSLRTYLTVVIHRLFLDYRIRLWGKWRPSAEAKRLGAVAIALERLIVRDGWSFEQAVEVLRTNHGVDESRDELYALHVKLSPCAPTRHFISQDAARDVPSPTPAPDDNLIRAERDFLENRVSLALERARQDLEPEERLILKMRFDDAVPVSEIARALHLNQKRLYRTIDRIFERLRTSLMGDGISAEDAGTLFGELGETHG